MSEYINCPTVCCTLIPCADGLVLIRRGDKARDGYGQLALVGGFQEGAVKEPVRMTARRELDEEIGFLPDPQDLQLVNIETDEFGHNVVFFEYVGRPLPKFEYIERLVTINEDEVMEVVLATEPVETAYPLHTAEIRKWFERNRTNA